MIVIWIMMITMIQMMNPAEGIIAYQCNNEQPSITTISLLEINACVQPKKTLMETTTHIQLLQVADFAIETVYQCKVIIERTIYYCGMHSHNSIVNGGYAEYIMPLSREGCMDLHKHRKLALAHNIIIDGLAPNTTVSRPVTLGGSIDQDGGCDGTKYSDQFGTWSNVVVSASVKISLYDYPATVNIRNNQMILRSGMKCDYLANQCVDIEGGDTFWNEAIKKECDHRQYVVLYEGTASRIDNRYDAMDEQRVVYTVTTKETTFALSVLNEKYICHQKAYQTEHPKLLIVVGTPGNYAVKKSKFITQNIDIFAYINSKLIYVEKHVRRQMFSLYYAIQNQKCELERQVLRNLLNLAVVAPEEFAYNFMKGPGYTAVTTGEVVHVVKCAPVEVIVRRTKECYHELPVTYQNMSYFMTPRNHRLQRIGTQIECNPFVVSMFRFHDFWFKLSPNLHETIPPVILKPSSTPVWKYYSPTDLASRGLYSQEDLSSLNAAMMFPAERAAVINTIGRSVAGTTTNLQGLQLHNAFSKETLDRLINSTFEKTWGWFSWLGNLLSGFIGVWLMGKMIKFAVDTVIHGWALYSVFGFSVKLMGSVWDSMTNALL